MNKLKINFIFLVAEKLFLVTVLLNIKVKSMHIFSAYYYNS